MYVYVRWSYTSQAMHKIRWAYVCFVALREEAPGSADCWWCSSCRAFSGSVPILSGRLLRLSLRLQRWIPWRLWKPRRDELFGNEWTDDDGDDDDTTSSRVSLRSFPPCGPVTASFCSLSYSFTSDCDSSDGIIFSETYDLFLCFSSDTCKYCNLKMQQNKSE